MKVRLMIASLVALGLAARMVTVSAQSGRHHEGTVEVPDSSVEHGGDRGRAAHTNHVIHQRGPAPKGPSGETPQSLIPYYVPGYPSQKNGSNPNPGSGLIVIVDAYDYPSALADFNTFSSQFGLPTEPSGSATAGTNKVFQVIYANGSRPGGNCGWGQEAALDIEWAHAVAPNAKIVLVEAATASFADLFKAVDVATGLQANVSTPIQVSMSWGGSEFSGETASDLHFTANGKVAYLAASGDTGGKTIYPSTSPYVIAAGGTSLLGTPTSITGEKGWSGSGGGTSPYEPRHQYQDGIQNLVGIHRGTPDISFDADPATGVSVYDSAKCNGVSGWLVFGGTSVASPALAGIVNLNTAVTSALGQSLLPAIYDVNNKSYFHDIATGTAGSFTAKVGWDFVTGVGSNKSLGWK